MPNLVDDLNDQDILAMQMVCQALTPHTMLESTLMFSSAATSPSLKAPHPSAISSPTTNGVTSNTTLMSGSTI